MALCCTEQTSYAQLLNSKSLRCNQCFSYKTIWVLLASNLWASLILKWLQRAIGISSFMFDNSNFQISLTFTNVLPTALTDRLIDRVLAENSFSLRIKFTIYKFSIFYLLFCYNFISFVEEWSPAALRPVPTWASHWKQRNGLCPRRLLAILILELIIFLVVQN